MELNVWTGANVTSAAPDASNIWHVTVKQANGQDRVFKVKHFVFATGLGVGMKMPIYPGMVSEIVRASRRDDRRCL
jgi:hypothetical protein